MMTNPILDKITKLNAEIEQLRAEVLEQARLLGMSGEREAKLLAEIERLRALVEKLERVRAAAQVFIDYDDAGFEMSVVVFEQKFQSLRAALKETTP